MATWQHVVRMESDCDVGEVIRKQKNISIMLGVKTKKPQNNRVVK